MKKIVIVLFTISTILSCANKGNKENINIRLSNVSQFNFKNIIVNTSTGNVSFENIESGEKSEFKPFELAYSYAYIELEIDDVKYTLQPKDYVGEKPLENGNYTYELNTSSRTGFNSLTLKLLNK